MSTGPVYVSSAATDRFWKVEDGKCLLFSHWHRDGKEVGRVSLATLREDIRRGDRKVITPQAAEEIKAGWPTLEAAS